MAHLVQINNLGPSSVGRSIIRTSAVGVPEYYAPGANGEVLTIVGGVPTWAAITFPSEFEAHPNQGAFPGVGSLDSIYYSAADNAFYIWDGAVYVEVPTAAAFSFTASGSGGGVNQTISNGDTLSFQTGNGFSFTGVATDIINLAVPLGTITGQVLTWNNGTSTWAAVVPPTLTVAGSAGTNPSIVIGTDTLSILGGTGINTTGNAGADSITVSLNAALNDLNDVDVTGAVTTNILVFDGADWVDTDGCVWLGNFSIDCLSDVDTTTTPPGVGDYLAWDGTNFVPTAPGGGFTSWTLAGDAGANQTISDGNVVTFIGGAGIATTTSATDNITIAYDGSLNNNSDVNITAPAVNEILVFDGADWVDTNGCTWLGNFSIDCLSDVNTAGSANGSMLYFDGANWIDFAIGAAGQVLTVAGGIPTWAANTGESTTVSDTNSVDLTLTGFDIEADVIISGNAGQTLSIGTTGVGSIQAVDEFTNVLDGSTSVTLTTAPLAGSITFLYVDGVLQPQSEIVSIAGTLLTFATATSSPVGGPANATDITVVYWIAAT